MTSNYLIPLLTSSVLACSISPAWGQENTTSNIAFACEDNQGVPITVVRNKEGKTQTLFYWKEEFLKYKTMKTPQEICNVVSSKLNDLSASGRDLSSLKFTARKEFELPVVCATIESFSACKKLLFTLYPVTNQRSEEIAYNTLKAIINETIILEEFDPCQHRCYCPPVPILKINLFQNEE